MTHLTCEELQKAKADVLALIANGQLRFELSPGHSKIMFGGPVVDLNVKFAGQTIYADSFSPPGGGSGRCGPG